MSRSLYAFTADTPRGIYTCSTYRASLSSKYGICQSLQADEQTLDLASMSVGPVSVGNIVSGIFLLGCVMGILGLLKWAMEERVRRRRRRRRAWGVEMGKRRRRRSKGCDGGSDMGDIGGGKEGWGMWKRGKKAEKW